MHRHQNRKARRREQALQRKRWRDGMLTFQRQMRAGRFGEHGAFELYVVRPNTRPPYGFASATARWLRAVADGERPLCLCCDHEFLSAGDPAAAWAFAVPLHSAPTMAIVTGVCERCGRRSDDEIIGSAYRQFRQMGLASAMLDAGAA
jgi:hypothetical protein